MPINCNILNLSSDDAFEENNQIELTDKLLVPPVNNPAEFCYKNFKPRYNDQNNLIKLWKGTTTLAFIYGPPENQKIIVSVDSRATQGGFIASNHVHKIIEINSHILCTMAGGAADCQYWESNLSTECNLFELRNKQRISVTAASKLFHNTVYYYKSYGLSIGAMVAGFDGDDALLYYVDAEGSRYKFSSERPYFSVGSGSLFAYGILDSEYRRDLTGIFYFLLYFLYR